MRESTMTLSDIFLLAALGCAVVLAVMSLRRNKKKGGCCGCAGCPMAGNCHQEEQNHE